MNENPNKSHYNAQFVFDTPTYGWPAPTPPAKPKKISKSLVAALAAASLAGGAFGAAAVVGVGALAGGGGTLIVNNTAAVNWVTASAAKASPSVVTISVSGGSASGSGSGVILSTDGYILTNTHVVTLEGATSTPTIEVKTADDRVFSATLIGTDPTNDLAVIKVNPIGKLVPASWAQSSNLNVGQEVIAIGAPLGLDSTVTAGIVSALNRTIQVANSAAPESGSGGGLQFWNGTGSAQPINITVIQTDAAINPGNSGGALVNQTGEVIGINVAIATAGSSGSGQSGSIGVGFAIPSETAQRIAAEIIKSGSASHGLLGAMVSDAASSNTDAAFSVGAKVQELTAGGAAEKGGLKIGDIVVSLNGRTIESASDLTAAVRQQPAGAKVTIVVQRGSEQVTLAVTLGNAKDLKPSN